MAKAYTELERQGVISTEAGRGCFISGTASPLRKDARIKLVIADIDQAVVQAHHQQIGRDEFVRVATERYDAFKQRRTDAEKG